VRASIVIPALNEEKNLARSLPVIRKQLTGDDEVIVVDNGSTDKTAEIAAAHGAAVIVESARNRSRARNVGYRRSRGEFVIFLDGDCYPRSNWLESLLARFADPAVGCVAGEIEILNQADPLQCYLSQKGYLTQTVNFAHPFLPYAGGANLAFRRSVLERIGVFDEALFSGHDADLCWRMQLETKFKIVLVEDAVVGHYQNTSWRALLRQKRRHAHGAVLLFAKYRNLRANERRALKQVYWEYRSILRRLALFGLRHLKAKFKLCPADTSPADYQLLLEVADKCGRIEGSLRSRILFL
jgi:glycosyltransferase involved in cell wall biosynthesis